MIIILSDKYVLSLPGRCYGSTITCRMEGYSHTISDPEEVKNILCQLK